MGLCRLDLYHLGLISDRYDPRDIRRVCDLGEQDFYHENLAPIEQFAALMETDEAAILASKTSAEMWRACGRRCLSLDMVGTDFLRFDLNTDKVPRKLAAGFDLVTNFGTSEHVANQLNTFRVMHDLTRPGGIMFHVVPSAGHSNHGFFCYDMRFFFCLAKANDYGVIDAVVSVDAGTGGLNQDIVEYCARFDRGGDIFHRSSLTTMFNSNNAGIRLILRRPYARSDFRTPLDLG